MQHHKDVSCFIAKHLKYENIDELEGYVNKHFEYGTIDYAVDNIGEVVAVVRWDVNDNVFKIIDFVIREDYRNKGFGKKFILRGLKRFPNVEYLEFKRGARGDNRVKKLKISGILKRNIF